LFGGGRLRLRGNCHCHSTFSDGTYSAEETVARYRDAGYDFLYLTEHCAKLTYGKFPNFDALDSPDFKVLPGVEYRAANCRKPISALLARLSRKTAACRRVYAF
tara:strand:- start:4189 stop:4500 length:312 start_codon:yes stop_codon:yes gene_type:complete